MREKGILFMVFLFCATGHAQTDSPGLSAEVVRAITRPSADLKLSFVQPGRVVRVLQKNGARVQAGEMLVQLDDAVEQIILAQMQAAGEDTTQIQASQASLDQKCLDLKRLEKAAAAKAVTKLEVEHAILDVKIAELALKMAVFEHGQAKLKFKETQKRLANMQLLSPINGIVEEVVTDVGESVNGLEEVMRIVQIDPLWVDASVPTSTARSLRKDQSVQLVFPGSESRTSTGRVIFISSVADAGSGTLTVRIEVPNKSARPAGEHVRVQFGSP